MQMLRCLFCILGYNIILIHDAYKVSELKVLGAALEKGIVNQSTEVYFIFLCFSYFFEKKILLWINIF